MNEFTVLTAGGTVDGLTHRYTFAPTFESRERVLLFLVHADTDRYFVWKRLKGKFRLREQLILGPQLPLIAARNLVDGYIRNERP